MFINELPDDCLLIIFGQINELDDLLNCYKVCTKWSRLVAERTKTVKYLIGHRVDVWQVVEIPRNMFGYVYYKSEAPIDGTCLSTLFPNLIIADFSGFREKVKYEDMVTFVKKITPLKGLIHKYDTRGELVFQYCDQLEMLSTNYVDPCMEKNGANIKQLRLDNHRLDTFNKLANYFPNLERLYIYVNEAMTNSCYNGPILSRLKIIELFLSSYDDARDIYYGFQLMDSCPNLQSAYIYLKSKRIFLDESLKLEYLQDLVLQFDSFDYTGKGNVDWNALSRMFMKYPNLKHLFVCNYKKLENKHVEQLVRILPNLVLFGVSECPRVTQKAANYVQDYNKIHGRSIKFYFDENFREIFSDWPQLAYNFEKISQGFDFMKNCFLKDFHTLATFLITGDD